MQERLSAVSRTGRLGELIVAFHLEAQGVQTAVVDREEVDIWFRTPSGRMGTLQVKTASSPKLYAKTALRYNFRIPKTSSADLFALVALDRGLVLIFPHSPKGLQNIQPDSFTKEAMEASIARYLA